MEIHYADSHYIEEYGNRKIFMAISETYFKI